MIGLTLINETCKLVRSLRIHLVVLSSFLRSVPAAIKSHWNRIDDDGSRSLQSEVNVITVAGDLHHLVLPSNNEILQVKRAIKAHRLDISYNYELVLNASIMSNSDVLYAFPPKVTFNLIRVQYDHDKEEHKELLRAISHANLEQIECLMWRHADPNYVDARQATPLLWASKKGHLQVVRFLCEARASLDQAGLHGVTALLLASHPGHLELAQFLCEARAAVDQADQDGVTPLSMATQEGHLELARYLCEARAAVDQAEQDGVTPLLIAAQEGHLELALCLCEARAAVDQAEQN